MVFTEPTNYGFILPSKQNHTQILFSRRRKIIVAWCFIKQPNMSKNFGVMKISLLTSPWLLDMLSRLSALLRNKSCKRLRSRPKRSIKRSLSADFSLWTLIMHKPDNGRRRPVFWHDYEQLTRIRTSRRLYKFSIWIMKTRHSKYSFALSIHSDVRTTPIKTFSHKSAQTYSSKPHSFILRGKACISVFWHSSTSVTLRSGSGGDDWGDLHPKI